MCVCVGGGGAEAQTRPEKKVGSLSYPTDCEVTTSLETERKGYQTNQNYPQKEGATSERQNTITKQKHAGMHPQTHRRQHTITQVRGCGL